MNRTLLLAAAAAATLSIVACQKKEATTPDVAASQTAAAAEAAAPAAATTAEAIIAQDATAGPIETVPTAARTTGAARAPSATTAPSAPGATTAPNATGTEQTEALIRGVTLSDMYQIQAGKIAEAKGQAQEVKDFGKTMVASHTAMSNQMRHIFAATSLTVPTELGPRGKRMLDALNAAAPADFDKLYLDQQQTAQAAELALLSAYAAGGESSDIRPAAAKAIPKVQGHLAKVHELQAALK